MNFVKKFLIGKRIKSKIKALKGVEVLNKIKALLLLDLFTGPWAL